LTSILHISTTDCIGGSGRSAYRIHNGLRISGYNSKMLVSRKITIDREVDFISKGTYKYYDRFCGRVLNRIGLNDVFYPSSYNLKNNKWFKEADIIQLYNLHGNYFSFTALSQISKYKTIVWRLSDMWPITGHCAYSYDCEKWKTGCGKCPYPEEYPELQTDTTKYLWKLKKITFDKIENMVIVAPSLWIKKNVEQSPILDGFKVLYIPNGVDTNIFKQKDKNEAKQKYNISKDSKVVLFIAEQLNTDKRKGGAYLVKALNSLNESLKKNIVLLMIGKEEMTNCGIDKNIKIYKAGYINNDIDLAGLYQAADIMVLPTLADNLPNTILESMACGTPVVSFNVGGIPEIVKHKETGYLAELKNVNDLKNGIEKLLIDDDLRTNLSKQSVILINNNFKLKNEVKGYIELYKQI